MKRDDLLRTYNSDLRAAKVNTRWRSFYDANRYTSSGKWNQYRALRVVAHNDQRSVTRANGGRRKHYWNCAAVIAGRNCERRRGAIGRTLRNTDDVIANSRRERSDSERTSAGETSALTRNRRSIINHKKRGRII